MLPETVQHAIQKTPWRFDFVQLMRLLYLHDERSDNLSRKLVGYENAPTDEVARFRTSPRMRHGAGDITSIKNIENERYEIEVSFMGLIGAAGVLPHHYSQTILERLRANDESMLEFFNLFHHRILSSYFRASVKYRLPFQHEIFSRFRSHSGAANRSRRIEHDRVSSSIACVAGVGEASVQDRQAFDDRARMYFAGHFSNRRPTPIGLARMLGEFTGFAVNVHSFQFEWLYLDQNDQTCFSDSPKALGVDAVVGDRVGSIQNRFRVRIGPLRWDEFQQLLPMGGRLEKTAQFVRSYVGIGLDFDFQFAIEGSEIPGLQLGNESCRLGWSTWIRSNELSGEIDDAIFEVADGFRS